MGGESFQRRNFALVKNGYTFVFIPEKTAKVWQLKIPKPVFVGGAVLGALLLIAAILAGVRAVRMEIELRAFATLKNQYLRQQIAIKKVSNQVETFKEQISRLRELDYKLRIITDLEVERPRPALYGIGGSIDTRSGVGKNEDFSKMDLLTLLDKDLARLKEIANYQEESFNNLKAHLADRTGTRTALELERRYVRRTLPRGVFRGLGDVARRDAAGAARSAAILAGTAAAAGSYAAGSLTSALSVPGQSTWRR